MTLADAFFDAYIDANILLIFAFSLWIIARFLMLRMGMAHAFTTQLHLLKIGFLAVAVSPFFAICFAFVLQSGWIGSSFSVNLSDFVVARYLDGGFTMRPSQLEGLLAIRGDLTSDLLGLNSTAGIAIAALFAIGATATLARMLISVVRLRRIIRTSFAWRRFGNIHLRLSDRVQVPFSTRGLRNHYIVIPSGMLARGDDLKMALGHEFQHLRQGDIEWEVVLELLRPLFFWNPAFVFWKRQADHLRELACDQQLLARRGYDLQAYCECLLRVCHNSLRTDRRVQIMSPTVAFVQIDRSIFHANSVGFLRHRVTSLFDAKPDRRHTKNLGLLMAPMLLMIVFVSVAIQDSGDWSQDRLMLSAIVNLERLDARNSVGW